MYVPVTKPFGLRVRGIMVFGQPDLGDSMAAGGRAELIGRTPAYLNLVRLYGGGGFFGFEFFLHAKMPFFLEVGGNSGTVGTSGAGATIEAGVQMYPF